MFWVDSSRSYSAALWQGLMVIITIAWGVWVLSGKPKTGAFMLGSATGLLVTGVLLAFVIV